MCVWAQRHSMEDVRQHPWMHRRQGEEDIVTEHAGQVQVDACVREQMIQMGLPPESMNTSIATDRWAALLLGRVI